MCNYVDDKSVAPGWGCCRCRTYNGMHRKRCSHCHTERCTEFKPDKDLGTVFETRINHFPALFGTRVIDDERVDQFAIAIQRMAEVNDKIEAGYKYYDANGRIVDSLYSICRAMERNEPLRVIGPS